MSSGSVASTVGALLRAVTYASRFIGLVLVFLPGRLLEWSGIREPATGTMSRIAGLALGAGGAALAVWCVLTFALVGKGTPAPFDPPRRLVIAGPYRVVRNPMYVGAGAAVLGAAVYYGSLALLAYVVGFVAIMHAFVRWYEEPTLERLFGSAYEAYRATTPRWVPRLPR